MVSTLLAGIGLLLVSLLLYGMAAAFLMSLIVGLIQKGYAGQLFWQNVAVMMIVSLFTAAAHLIQIALWAVFLQLCGEMSTFERAFYCSAQNYTALGYGDVLLSDRWRLLGPLEAINGLLLFGVSTAVMFAVMSRLIAIRIRRRFGRPGGAADNREPSSAVSSGGFHSSDGGATND
jgi:hypothetical protein